MIHGKTMSMNSKKKEESGKKSCASWRVKLTCLNKNKRGSWKSTRTRWWLTWSRRKTSSKWNKTTCKSQIQRGLKSIRKVKMSWCQIARFLLQLRSNASKKPSKENKSSCKALQSWKSNKNNWWEWLKGVEFSSKEWIPNCHLIISYTEDQLIQASKCKRAPCYQLWRKLLAQVLL